MRIGKLEDRFKKDKLIYSGPVEAFHGGFSALKGFLLSGGILRITPPYHKDFKPIYDIHQDYEDFIKFIND